MSTWRTVRSRLGRPGTCSWTWTLEPGDATSPEEGDRTVLTADLDLSDWKGGLS